MRQAYPTLPSLPPPGPTWVSWLPQVQLLSVAERLRLNIAVHVPCERHIRVQLEHVVAQLQRPRCYKPTLQKDALRSVPELGGNLLQAKALQPHAAQTRPVHRHRGTFVLVVGVHNVVVVAKVLYV